MWSLSHAHACTHACTHTVIKKSDKIVFSFDMFNVLVNTIAIWQLCTCDMFKVSIFLENRHFILQERFNKFIYDINTTIKCGTRQPVKFQLVSHSWNEMIFYRIFELMLPTLIQRYNEKKNNFHFGPVQKRETNWNFNGCQMPHFMMVLILFINLLNLPWIKECLFLRNMEPLIL